MNENQLTREWLSRRWLDEAPVAEGLDGYLDAVFLSHTQALEAKEAEARGIWEHRYHLADNALSIRNQEIAALIKKHGDEMEERQREVDDSLDERNHSQQLVELSERTITTLRAELAEAKKGRYALGQEVQVYIGGPNKIWLDAKVGVYAPGWALSPDFEVREKS